MLAFGNFMSQFAEYRASSDMADMASNSAKYIWEMPADALEEWKTSIDEYEEKFTEEELNNFRSMFAVGQKIVNIPVAAYSKDSYVRLYQLTEYDYSFIIPDVLCSVDYNIIEDSPYTADVTLSSGNKTTIPNLILPKSIIFDEGGFDGVDSPIISPYGLIRGDGFNKLLRDHNRLNGDSIFGFVNYATGDFHLIRSNIENEEKFETYYDKLAASAASSGSSSSSSSGSSSSSSSQSEPEPPPEPYDYLNITGTLKLLNAPVTVVFETDVDQDPY